MNANQSTKDVSKILTGYIQLVVYSTLLWYTLTQDVHSIYKKLTDHVNYMSFLWSPFINLASIIIRPLRTCQWPMSLIQVPYWYYLQMLLASFPLGFRTHRMEHLRSVFKIISVFKKWLSSDFVCWRFRGLCSHGVTSSWESNFDAIATLAKVVSLRTHTRTNAHHRCAQRK